MKKQENKGEQPSDENKQSLTDHAKDEWRDDTLKLAGYGYLLGDAALLAAGVASGRAKEASTGALWAAGGLALARYGKPDSERQLAQLSERLGKFLKAEGVDVPQGSELSSEALNRNGGIWEKVEDFLYANPSQVLNATYAIGAVQLVRSGLQHNKHWDTASGVLVGTGALAGLLIPEKEEEEKKEPSPAATTALGKAWGWLREKPLRASGYLYTANNITLLASAMGEKRSNPADKTYMFKLLTVASYVVSNALLSMSSKDHNTQGDQAARKKMRSELEQRAAQMIASQPQEVQDAVIKHTAGFLAAQPEVHRPASELARELQQQVYRLAENKPLLSDQPDDRVVNAQLQKPTPIQSAHLSS